MNKMSNFLQVLKIIVQFYLQNGNIQEMRLSNDFF